MAPGSLVVVRHGRTSWNTAGRFQGHADPPLDPVGAAQAEQVATELAALVGAQRPAVLSSDLDRAAATATAVVRAIGAELSLDRDLREVDLGGWTGLDHDEAQTRFPEEFRLWQAGFDVRRGGGETEAEAGERVANRVERAVAEAPGRSLIVVGHGVALRAGLEALRDRGAVAFSGPGPHLGNGRYFTALPITRPSWAETSV